MKLFKKSLGDLDLFEEAVKSMDAVTKGGPGSGNRGHGGRPGKRGGSAPRKGAVTFNAPEPPSQWGPKRSKVLAFLDERIKEGRNPEIVDTPEKREAYIESVFGEELSYMADNGGAIPAAVILKAMWDSNDQNRVMVNELRKRFEENTGESIGAGFDEPFYPHFTPAGQYGRKFDKLMNNGARPVEYLSDMALAIAGRDGATNHKRTERLLQMLYSAMEAGNYHKFNQSVEREIEIQKNDRYD